MDAVLIVVSFAVGLGLLWTRRAAGHQTVPGRLAAVMLFVIILATWITRWLASGHFPLFGTYESAMSLALATAMAGLIWPVAAGTTSLMAALVLAQGFTYDRTMYALTISERSLVVDSHAVLAWIAFAVYTAALGVALHVALRRESAAEPLLDRTLLLGFALHTAMIVSGSLYKFMLFGKVWSWDPIETMALISWLAYGTLIHMPLLAGWGSRRVARWSIATFVVLVVSYRAIVYFPSFATYHIFDIGLKLHLP